MHSVFLENSIFKHATYLEMAAPSQQDKKEQHRYIPIFSCNVPKFCSEHSHIMFTLHVYGMTVILECGGDSDGITGKKAAKPVSTIRSF